jgi:adenylate kinase family enzyme
MERVVVLGVGGAGKTELAHELSRRTGLPVVHLDLLFWRPGWELAPRDEARVALDAAVAEERWIIDGNFLSAGDARFERADTVVFLDLPRTTCIARVLRRTVRDRRRGRPDLPEGCREGFDWAFIKWIWNFGRDDRPRILERLRQTEADVVHPRSPAEVRRYVESLRLSGLRPVFRGGSRPSAERGRSPCPCSIRPRSAAGRPRLSAGRRPRASTG